MTSGGADADGSQSTEGSTAGCPDEEEGGGRETHAGGCGGNEQYYVRPKISHAGRMSWPIRDDDRSPGSRDHSHCGIN